MNTSIFWEWVRAFPFSIESRRLTPPGPNIEYAKRSRITVYCIAAAVLLEVLFSPLSHAPVAARAAVLILMAAGTGLWLAASIRYALAWDELQRRALAESGAVTAVILVGILLFYSLVEKLFGAPHMTALVWFVLGIATWFIALPLIRRHYEA